MAKFSVFVRKKENNNFFDSLFNEVGNEIIAEISENKIVFNYFDGFNKEKLYNVLSKNIFEEFSKKILVKIINNNCSYLSKQDKYEIWKRSFKCIMNDMIENNFEHLYRISVIKNNLVDFCEKSESICIDGFVNFRLKELEHDFEDVVEDCVQDYMTELEYAEFINMLKYFVSIQNSLFFSVEIIYGENITIFADGKNITDKCVEEFSKELKVIEDNTDDFLLNSLISIAPKRIVIKQINRCLNAEFKKTLLGIFGDKLKIKTE